MQTIVHLQGPQGCGKSTFWKICKLLLGSVFYSEVQTIEDLCARFNQHLDTNLIIHIEDLKNGESKDSANTFKYLVTQETRKSEGKGMQPNFFKSYTFYVTSGNTEGERPRHVVGGKERRPVIVKCSAANVDDRRPSIGAV